MILRTDQYTLDSKKQKKTDNHGAKLTIISHSLIVITCFYLFIFL